MNRMIEIIDINDFSELKMKKPRQARLFLTE
jgi:hypothetical protein